jgi:hypothetical protein
VALAALFIGACSAATESTAVEVTAELPDTPLTYGELVAESEPLGYWSLDETSVDLAAEANSSTVAGQYRGGVRLGEQPAIGSGTSVHFDGSTGYVWIGESSGDAAQSLVSSDALTVEMWFRPEVLPSDAGAMHLARWRWYGWGIYVRDGRLHAELWEDTGTDLRGTTLDGPDLAIDSWHHIAMTRDADAIRLYVDGEQIDEEQASGKVYQLAIDAADDCCGIGGGVAFGRDADVDGNYLAGWLDELAIYPTALSQETLAEHHGFGG